MPNQNVVVVAGFNYENLKNPIFVQCANNRIARLLAASKSPKNLVFTLCDVGEGVIKQSKVDAKTGKRAWNNLQTFTKVTAANYSVFTTGKENAFNKNPSGVMSITDIYVLIQGIGAGADKGTVMELSFFSHGFMGGPILVNSYDMSGDPAARDPDDKDAREWKDFQAPTMDAKALGNFKAAFANSAVVWIWGCVFYSAVNKVLGRLFKTSKFRSTPPGKLKDTEKFTLDFSEDNPKPSPDDDFNTIVSTILPGGKLSGHNYSVTVTLDEIRQALEAVSSRTYADKMAKVLPSLGTVFAALPGTGTDYEELDKSVHLPLMLVPRRSPPFSNNFSQSVTFYKTYVGVALDPEGRGYGAF